MNDPNVIADILEGPLSIHKIKVSQIIVAKHPREKFYWKNIGEIFNQINHETWRASLGNETSHHTSWAPNIISIYLKGHSQGKLSWNKNISQVHKIHIYAPEEKFVIKLRAIMKYLQDQNIHETTM